MKYRTRTHYTDSQKAVSSTFTPSTNVSYRNYPDQRTAFVTFKYQL